jgi:hypothetical protein
MEKKVSEDREAVEQAFREIRKLREVSFDTSLPDNDRISAWKQQYEIFDLQITTRLSTVPGITEEDVNSIHKDFQKIFSGVTDEQVMTLIKCDMLLCEHIGPLLSPLP